MKSSFLENASLVFDLDGTLVDTAPDLIATLNHVLAQLNCAPTDEAHIRPFISFGARRMIVEGLLQAGRALRDSEIDGIFVNFLDHYGENVAVKSAPYPNAVSVLEQVAELGARLGVCTNKREDLSRSLLTQLKLYDRFGAIVGRDTLEVCKPHPRHLTETIARIGGNRDKAVMIGDSPTDVATARAANIPVVAVSFGYSEVPAYDLGADVVIDDYADLLDVLPQLIGQ